MLIQADALPCPMGCQRLCWKYIVLRAVSRICSSLSKLVVLKLKIPYAGKPPNTEKKRRLVTIG